MESSIAEFLMRQLASEQLPTSHACEHDAHRVACAPGPLQPSPSPLQALRSGARPTRIHAHPHSQAPWIDGTCASTGSAATAALVRTFAEYTFSAFWL